MSSIANTVQRILKYTFGILPIAAGLDKFVNVLTNWGQYMAPWIENLLPVSTDSFMIIIGVIEIIAGILVWSKTQIGAYVVAGWLLAIAFSLITAGHYLDVAVRDIVMAIAAYCLARLSEDNLGT